LSDFDVIQAQHMQPPPHKKSRGKIIGFIFVFLLVALGGFGAWMWQQGWRPPGMGPTFQLPPAPSTKGISLTSIEKSLPDGAWVVIGGKDLAKELTEFRQSNFYQAFRAFYSSMTVTQDIQKKLSKFNQFPLLDIKLKGKDFSWWDVFGGRFSIALYNTGKSTDSFSIVFVASVPVGSPFLEAIRSQTQKVDPLGELIRGQGYFGYIKDHIIVISDQEELVVQTQKSYQTGGGSSNLLARASRRISNRSVIYYVWDMEKARELKFFAQKAQSQGGFANKDILWSSVGIHFDKGLRIDAWAQAIPQVKPNSIMRQAPRPRHFMGGLNLNTIMFASVRLPLLRVYEELVEVLEKNPQSTFVNDAFEKFEEKHDFSWEEDILTQLDDEAGFYLTHWPTEQIIPPIGFYVRIRNRWKAYFALKKLFSKEEGWKKEDGMYVYSPKTSFSSMIGPLEIACALSKDTLVFGVKSAVQEAIAEDSGDAPQSIPKTLEKLKVPESVTTLQYFDFGYLFSRIMASLKPYAPLLARGKMAATFDWDMYDLENLLSWWPSIGSYNVITEEGVYSQSLMSFRDESREKWDQRFSLLLKLSQSLQKNSKATGQAQTTKNKKPEIIIHRPGEAKSQDDKENQEKVEKMPSEVKKETPSQEEVAKEEDLGDDEWGSLVEMLQSSDWMTRRQAAQALGEVGSQRYISHLKKLMSDSQSEVRVAADQAIRKIRSKSP